MSDCIHCDIHELLEIRLQNQEVNLAEIAAKVTEVLADLILMAPPDEQSTLMADMLANLGGFLPVEAGREEVRLETGVFDPHKFNELAAPVEAKANAPWLKKFRENGVDVVRKIDVPEGQKTGLAPLATPEEIENGVFADDREAYRKLTGRAA